MVFVQLLESRYWPTTSQFGFLESDAKRAARNCRNWLSEITSHRKISCEISELVAPMSELFDRLAPLTDVEIRRYLFVPTLSPWTAYFDNGSAGAEPARVSYLSKLLDCRGVNICCQSDTIEKVLGRELGNYGAVIFELYSAESEHISKLYRTVYSVNDGGRWVFDASGHELPFEDVSAYKARRIRDRFTPEMLQKYLLAIGINAFDEEFYITNKERPAYIIELVGEEFPNMRKISYREAQMK